MKRVLVVDDERRGRRVLQIMMEELGLESVAAASGEEAVELFQAQSAALVLTDLKMPDMSGLDVISRVREIDPEVPVIVLTAYGTVETAVEAMKRGAFDYVLRPFDVDALEAVVRKALEMRQYRLENRYLREQVQDALASAPLVAESPAMRRVADLLAQIAPTKSPVLITGETGTGKELVARAVHELSPRRSKLFVPINCAAIPAELLESELFGHARGAFTGAHRERAGKFEVADGGTLFLDEIGDMPYALQAKLLRVLEEGVVEPVGSNRRVNVEVRVVSSTNRDLSRAMREERFREDLYYRLNVFHIELPPLRERPEDVEPLARRFLARFCQDLGKPLPELPDGALDLLRQYAWPGNVRELRNLAERAAVLADRPVLDRDFFRPWLPAGDPPPPADAEPEDMKLEQALEQVERRFILRALGNTNDNKAQAAKLLGVSERTLWYKLKKYGL